MCIVATVCIIGADTNLNNVVQSSEYQHQQQQHILIMIKLVVVIIIITARLLCCPFVGSSPFHVVSLSASFVCVSLPDVTIPENVYASPIILLPSLQTFLFV